MFIPGASEELAVILGDHASQGPTQTLVSVAGSPDDARSPQDGHDQERRQGGQGQRECRDPPIDPSGHVQALHSLRRVSAPSG